MVGEWRDWLLVRTDDGVLCDAYGLRENRSIAWSIFEDTMRCVVRT
jgi:hypothetical protein